MRAAGERSVGPPGTPLYLWLLALSPGLWAVHFLVCYVGAAIWCARWAPPGAGLGPVRGVVAVATAVALAAIATTGWRGWRRHRGGGAHRPHDDDTPGDRHRFLGFATALLSGLSAVAVVFTALAAVFIGDCR
jgi:hypothetical protein